MRRPRATGRGLDRLLLDQAAAERGLARGRFRGLQAAVSLAMGQRADWPDHRWAKPLGETAVALPPFRRQTFSATPARRAPGLPAQSWTAGVAMFGHLARQRRPPRDRRLPAGFRTRRRSRRRRSSSRRIGGRRTTRLSMRGRRRLPCRCAAVRIVPSAGRDEDELGQDFGRRARGGVPLRGEASAFCGPMSRLRRRTGNGRLRGELFEAILSQPWSEANEDEALSILDKFTFGTDHAENLASQIPALAGLRIARSRARYHVLITLA